MRCVSINTRQPAQFNLHPSDLHPSDVCMLYVCLGTEPECRRTVGLLNYIRVDDCQSEEKIELTYCEASRCTFVYEGHNNITKLYTYNLSHLSFSHPQGKCSSKSRYSLEKHKVESECVCCSATGTVPMNVSLRCANGTRTHHQVLAVTGCDCMSHACPTD